ncbi:cinnamoyl-Coa reductase [Stylosanthes scabra]|uniref:Cinnamoyl-Coa reductase n=1 Tax=Stylosanthes scabra TaxID=79078 RepID=A0ABU6SS21_9FABA|nr:cinnamoyl-Coa reductase [Stylosanthes scabra]
MECLWLGCKRCLWPSLSLPFHKKISTTLENEADGVTLKILYCGVCHSDLHTIKNHWGFTTYPVVPG